jgi:hypothetical protein
MSTAHGFVVVTYTQIIVYSNRTEGKTLSIGRGLIPLLLASSTSFDTAIQGVRGGYDSLFNEYIACICFLDRIG